MDRAFLAYYQNELTHLREMAQEFGQMHETVARNLSLDSVPCPDPYVERLLEGVAYLGARTHQKLDREGSRYVRRLLDALYPDLSAPSPAVGMAALGPGPQVETMQDGHRVERGTRMVAGLREGLSTRAVYSTAQDVDLWPIQISEAEYLSDRSALRAAGASDGVLGPAASGLRLVLQRNMPAPFHELSLDQLDIYLGCDANGPTLFDAIFGWGVGAIARPGDKDARFLPIDAPSMVGLSDDEGLLPRARPSFEGYRLLREYFLLPERFHYARLSGLRDVVSRTTANTVEIVILLDSPQTDLSRIKVQDFGLFVTPIVNLFERECNIVELDVRRPSHVVHADRTRPRDFEIYGLLRVEDAEHDGPGARLNDLYSSEPQNRTNLVYATDRRARRPANDEIDAQRMRSAYHGDDFLISVSRPPDMASTRQVKRLDIRALCTNRDIPILDDTPKLSMESGDPITNIRLLQALSRPRPSLSAHIPERGQSGDADMDEISWRWIAQLSLAQLSIAEEGAEVLKSLISLYSDRGDPGASRHGRSIVDVQSRSAIDRIDLPGPVCFAHGTDITLSVDTAQLSGSSRLLLSAVLSRLFAREAATNSFVRTRTWLVSEQKEVAWPSTVGTRSLI
ncbi:type VI secretion system baseplate subunit TssF [Rhodobacteraceae bacterium]|nr:type VI secretion system baseplate subunit TssF [Paracoccaceae bacterium]